MTHVTKLTTIERLTNAEEAANDLVIAMSLGIMDTNASPGTVAQARMLQPLFAAIREVISDSRRNYWEPGKAPDDWESFDSSRVVLNLADVISGFRK